MEDHFSTFMSPEVKNQVRADNQQMYYDIENYKMGAFVTRVMDSYSRKFQTCNEISRKNMPDKKKKNAPPVLVNFPVFARNATNDE